MIEGQLADADTRMTKALDHLRGELASLRSGRATPALVDDLPVEVYGQRMVLKQVASINTPDAQTIAITPWDPANLAAVEKAIREATSLGLNPSSDGQVIRLAIPPLTEETRQGIVKQLGEKIEQCRIALRNIRRDVLGEVRRLEKAKQVSQDQVKQAELKLNQKIEHYHGLIAEIEKNKTAELTEV